jgi:hypothetical protein
MGWVVGVTDCNSDLEASVSQFSTNLGRGQSPAASFGDSSNAINHWKLKHRDVLMIPF